MAPGAVARRVSATLTIVLASTQQTTGCSLKQQTTPLELSTDGAVLEFVNLTVGHGTDPALTITGKNIVVRDVAIYTGIHFINAHNLTLERVQVQAVGGCVNSSNPTGACHNPCTARLTACHNIWGDQTTGVAISDARVEGGSTGIELSNCEGAVLSRVAARNVRGPFPRGQCVQFSHSDGATLQNFTCVNEENKSWTEDAISAWRSSNVTIRQGIVDGNNSPHGVGVMFEGSEAATHGGLIEDVDAIHQGGGCFSGYPAQQLRQSGVRCAHSHCTGWAGRDKPMSGGHGWAAGNEDGVVSHGIVVEKAAYFDLCGPKLWWEQSPGGFAGLEDPAAPDAALGATNLSSFTPRSWGLNVVMCWDGADAPPPTAKQLPVEVVAETEEEEEEEEEKMVEVS